MQGFAIKLQIRIVLYRMEPKSNGLVLGMYCSVIYFEPIAEIARVVVWYFYITIFI